MRRVDFGMCYDTKFRLRLGFTIAGLSEGRRVTVLQFVFVGGVRVPPKVTFTRSGGPPEAEKSQHLA
jgi:hypothetical protein